MARWLHTLLGRKIGGGTGHLGAQGSHHQHERATIGLGSKEDLKPEVARGIWRLGLQDEVKFKQRSQVYKIGRIDEDNEHHIPKSLFKGKRGNKVRCKILSFDIALFTSFRIACAYFNLLQYLV